MAEHVICWFCGAPMQWDGNCTPEELGYTGEGIVATLECQDCGCIAEFFQGNLSEEEEGREQLYGF